MSSETTSSKGNSSSTVTQVGLGERQPATVRYFDRTDIDETFADSITSHRLRWSNAAH